MVCEGDMSHNIVNKRKNGHRVDGILNALREKTENYQEITRIFHEHFRSIVNEPHYVSKDQIMDVLNTIQVPVLPSKHIYGGSK